VSKAKFTGLKQVLTNSSFLDADPEGDLDDEDWTSEAAKVLRDTLNDYFDDKFGVGEINAIVETDFVPTMPSEGYDSVLKNASYIYDGFHNIRILLANLGPDASFRDMGPVHQKIYQVILHELVHMQQFLKFSHGKPDMEKWEAFNSEYKKRGGSSGMGPDYFFFDEEDSPSELETFSLQLANELVDSLGKDEAVRVLQQQHPDHDIIRDNSSTFRVIDKQSDITRPEFREMLKRAKQYAKMIS
jgi:hypothetical protein